MTPVFLFEIVEKVAACALSKDDARKKVWEDEKAQ